MDNYQGIQGQVVKGEDPWNRSFNNQGRAALTNWDAHPSTLLETNMTVIPGVIPSETPKRIF